MKAWATVLGGLLTAGLTISIAWASSDEFQNWLCDRPVVGQAPEKLGGCERWRAVTATEAEDAIDREIEKRSIPDLDGDRAWENVLWAERTSPLEQADDNTFHGTLRVYEGTSNEPRTGRMGTQAFTAEIEPGKDRATVTSLERDVLTNPDRLYYAELFARSGQAITPYSQPSTSSDTIGDWVAGAYFRGLCRTEVSEEQSGSVATWVRTPLGWLSEEQLTDADRSEPKIPKAVACYRAAIDR